MTGLNVVTVIVFWKSYYFEPQIHFKMSLDSFLSKLFLQKKMIELRLEFNTANVPAQVTAVHLTKPLRFKPFTQISGK